MRPPPFAAALVMAILFAAPAHAQNSPTVIARHWGVTIPAGWRTAPDESLRAFRENAATLVRGTTQPIPDYVELYVLENAVGTEFPYITAQYIPAELWKARPDEIAGFFNADVGRIAQESLREPLAQSGASAEVGKITFDPSLNRTLLRITLNNAAGEVVEGVCVGFVGNHGILQLAMYSSPDRYATTYADFSAMVDSFRFANGHAYGDPVSPTAGQTPSGRFGGILSTSLIGGALGAAIGGAIAVARRWGRGKAA